MFDPFFLKVSIDQLSQNLYIPIRNQQGGGPDISSFSWEKAWGQKETFVNYRQSEAPRPQAGASRARSGERKVSKGNIVLIVPLDPAYPALAGRGTCRPRIKIRPRSQPKLDYDTRNGNGLKRRLGLISGH